MDVVVVVVERVTAAVLVLLQYLYCYSTYTVTVLVLLQYCTVTVLVLLQYVYCYSTVLLQYCTVTVLYCYSTCTVTVRVLLLVTFAGSLQITRKGTVLNVIGHWQQQKQKVVSKTAASARDVVASVVIRLLSVHALLVRVLIVLCQQSLCKGPALLK